MLGGISNVSAQQGGNILLNMYNGVVSNAAFGIANQVSYAVYAFSSNFQIAFNPQITKLHAVGDSLHLNNLVNKASLFSYYLMLLFAVPFMINTEIILKLWLKNVPEYTVGFCQLMVVYQLIDAFQAPLNTLIFSTGKIKNYNIWLSALIFCNIPLSLYLLSIGKSPYYVLGIRAGINLLTAIIRVVYVRYFMNFPSLYYFLHVVLKILAVTVLAFSGSIWVKMNLNSDTGGFILSSLIAIIITGIVVYWIGIGKTERSFFHSILKNTSGSLEFMNKAFRILFLLFLSFVFIMGYWGENEMVMLTTLFSLFAYQCIYTFRNINDRITLLVFLVAFFTFLMGRILLPLFTDVNDLIVNIGGAEFHTQTYYHIYTSLFIALLFIYLGYHRAAQKIAAYR